MRRKSLGSVPKRNALGASVSKLWVVNKENGISRTKIYIVLILTFLVGVFFTFWHFKGRIVGTPKKMIPKNSSYEQLFSSVSSLIDLKDESTPQAKAMQWIIEDDPVQVLSTDPRALSRYVMALFIFSTFENESSNYLSWFGPRELCDWYGVECNFDGFIEQISIGESM